MPAVGALPARVTGTDQLARVQGLRGLAIRLASIVGAPLGGLGIALGGAAAAFSVAGPLIAVSVPLLVFVRMRSCPATGPRPRTPPPGGTWPPGSATSAATASSPR